MLEKVPDTWSKALKKKLQKEAQIAAKKIAKGGAPPAAKPAGEAKTAAKPEAAATEKKKPAPAVAAAAPAVPTGSGPTQGVVGSSEGAIVAQLLACAESLALPADAIATLRANEATLAIAIQPRVNALRNEAYALGFSSHGNRAEE